MPNIIDTVSLHDKVIDFFTNEKRIQDSFVIKPRHAFHQQERIVTGRLKGDEYMEKLRFLLRNGTGLDRSKRQIQIHEYCLMTCLPKIYGMDWDDNQEMLLERYKL